MTILAILSGSKFLYLVSSAVPPSCYQTEQYIVAVPSCYVVTNHSSSSESQLLAICMDMFMAGSETTTKSLGFCFLYLLLYPDVQRRAQAEIDTVVGRDRLPSLNDRPKWVLYFNMRSYSYTLQLTAVWMTGLPLLQDAIYGGHCSGISENVHGKNIQHSSQGFERHRAPGLWHSKG